VGSAVDAFGIVTGLTSDNATLDVSAGRVRLDNTTASGLVTAQGSGTLNLNLAFLGGRKIAPFDFAGTGATASQFVVTSAEAVETVGVPVIVTGLTSSFGAPPPNFTESALSSALLDPTTIPAELVVDWGTGTAAPFTTYDGTAIDVDARNSSIGVRHWIQVGAQLVNIVGLSSDPLIEPDATSSDTVFTIGHAASSTMESFDTYAAFITQLQTELNGSNLVTGMTATGQYTASIFSFTATGITLFLNN
jgi:hypothetical protein